MLTGCPWLLFAISLCIGCICAFARLVAATTDTYKPIFNLKSLLFKLTNFGVENPNGSSPFVRGLLKGLIERDTTPRHSLTDTLTHTLSHMNVCSLHDRFVFVAARRPNQISIPT